jgi:hypothetical protein
MGSLNTSSVSSGDYADMRTSVASVSSNKVLLDNISNVYNFENIIQLPMHFLRKYENIIKANLMDYKISENRFYRPEYVSYDLYGTTDLWYLILFCNDLRSPMELNFTDIKVPNSIYTLEIINKLKTIDNITSSHDNPIYIHRSLLKDLNSSSDKVIDTDNSFITNTTIQFEDNIDEFKDCYFKINRKDLSRDKYAEINTNNFYESAVNFGFRPDTEIYKSLGINDNESHNMYMIKNLKSDTTYYFLKRYCGKMNLSIESKDSNLKYHQNILTNEEVNMSPVILTYDLREATLAPEYLVENLVLNHEGKIYEPEIITDSDGNECYGFNINSKRYEIFFDGTAYYIVLEEDKLKNTKTIELLENKDEIDGKQINIYHSMNEWILNDKDSVLIKLDEDSEDLYFNEEYYYKDGQYVYSIVYDNDNMPSDGSNIRNIVYRIDINRDLQSNTNKLKNYEFLGFELNVSCKLEGYYNESTNRSLDNIDFSPLQITLVSNDLDDDGENIKYTFSYPYGVAPAEVTNYEDNFIDQYLDKDEYDEQPKLYKFKRIVPIIKDFESKERLDIKEILVSTYINNNNDEESFIGKLTVSCGTLKIFGLDYKDLVTEFMTPEMSSDYSDYYLYYDYSLKNTKYASNNNETNYFEPYVFEGNTNLLEILSDDINLNYLYRNNLNNIKDYTTLSSIDNSESGFTDIKTYTIKLNTTKEEHYFLEGLGASDYLNYTLYKKDGSLFDLADNYILEFKLETYLSGDTNKESYRDFRDNRILLNGYTLNHEKNIHSDIHKMCLNQNIEFLFNKQNDNYYMIKLSEEQLTTNNSSSRKNNNSSYINENLYLDNFNSYSFSVNTAENGDSNKEYYSKFKNWYIDEQTAEFSKKIIYTHSNNRFYTYPDGLYKVLSGEGTDNYQYYKYVDNVSINTYPILQTKVFNSNYLNSATNITDSNKITGEKNVYRNVTHTIYIKIKKINTSFYIYYKFNEEDDYKKLHSFDDFYKSINNGTLGLKFLNTIPYNEIEFLSYKIGK